eukprot:gnl/TRDRNA2_/TRDRNA2_85304_c0_seq2.p1 gnl/TRDRNA2_/TRDRNA2_85304_c0~~gnl/TRDRNA2_/TRDRNA2_85304_c0_seq2.p1  ORF type:complete len:272 (-),score=48.69 gnl/TRDRNA2_/TRDRNA2_85304_c0_seq2:49-810(-)
MSDVMDEIRAEARRRGEARDARAAEDRQRRKATEDMFRQMDRMPTQQAVSGAPLQNAAGRGRAESVDGASNSESWPLLQDGQGFTMAMCGASQTNPCQQLFGLAGWQLPSDRSFEVFFSQWFRTDHFPSFSKLLQKELNRRARTEGFLSGLASQVKGWAMANADERMQADVWYMYVMRNSPTRYGNYLCFRTASVNLGSKAVPCNVTWFGLPDASENWVLPPWGPSSQDVDCQSLLTEVDDQGGIAALVAAAA